MGNNLKRRIREEKKVGTMFRPVMWLFLFVSWFPAWTAPCAWGGVERTKNGVA